MLELSANPDRTFSSSPPASLMLLHENRFIQLLRRLNIGLKQSEPRRLQVSLYRRKIRMARGAVVPSSWGDLRMVRVQSSMDFDRAVISLAKTGRTTPRNVIHLIARWSSAEESNAYAFTERSTEGVAPVDSLSFPSRPSSMAPFSHGINFKPRLRERVAKATITSGEGLCFPFHEALFRVSKLRSRLRYCSIL